MKIIFYKYQFQFAYGTSKWHEEFEVVSDEIETKDFLKLTTEKLHSFHDHSDKYRGLEIEEIQPKTELLVNEIDTKREEIDRLNTEKEFLEKQLEKING